MPIINNKLPGDDYGEDRFNRWKMNMVDNLDDIKEDIQAMTFDKNSPGTSKRATVVVEMKIRALMECFA